MEPKGHCRRPGKLRASRQFGSVEPVRKDFLAGDIPSCVTFHLELQKKAATEVRVTVEEFCAMGVEEYVARRFELGLFKPQRSMSAAVGA